MAIELAAKFAPYVDEKFSTESKKSLITNQDFSFTNANTVKVYNISTSPMNDYKRHPVAGFTGSRFGEIKDLDATTETFLLSKDRSFTFAIDKMDDDETVGQLSAASALERQLREVVIPEVDDYTYGVMCTKAGHKPEAKSLSETGIYNDILAASEALDTAEVPETERYLLVTPKTYVLMKQSKDIILETDIGQEMKKKGIIGELDGCRVIKIPANRVPENFGFMMVHPCATVAPTKLADYRIHPDPPGISGALVEGRIYYDAFVLANKTKAIYYQEVKTATTTTTAK